MKLLVESLLNVFIVLRTVIFKIFHYLFICVFYTTFVRSEEGGAFGSVADLLGGNDVFW